MRGYEALCITWDNLDLLVGASCVNPAKHLSWAVGSVVCKD